MLSSTHAMYHVINTPMANAVINNNNNDLKQELNQLNAENEQLRRKLNTKTNECEKLKIKCKESRDECEQYKHLMRQLSDSMNVINNGNDTSSKQYFSPIVFSIFNVFLTYCAVFLFWIASYVLHLFFKYYFCFLNALRIVFCCSITF